MKNIESVLLNDKIPHHSFLATLLIEDFAFVFIYQQGLTQWTQR